MKNLHPDQDAAKMEQKKNLVLLDEGEESYLSAFSQVIKKGNTDDLKWLCEHRALWRGAK